MRKPFCRVRFHRIPIYDMRLWIGVADTTATLHKKFSWAFGSQSGAQIACVSYAGAKMGIFFEREELCHELIAHEVFHATLRVFEHIGHHTTPDGSEPAAYLAGWITERIYTDLAAMKVPIALKARQVPERFVPPPIAP